ncbi:tyrosine-type recombinase/integrase [bacterium]|nr:tyrosine-type recombinase/integrase [bacterium]
MDELALTKDLYLNLAGWMQNKYAITTQRQRLYFLKKIFKKRKVLNHETLRTIMKKVKYQHQRAAICMLNNYCYDNKISFNIRVPSVKKQAAKLPEILSAEEISVIIKAAPHPYDLALRCVFNMGAGLRVSEIIKMSWNHIRWVDWLRNQDNYGIVVIKSGKGSKDRVINIPMNLMKDLYKYAKDCNVLNEFRIPAGGVLFSFHTEREKENKRERDMVKLILNKDERGKVDYVQSRYNWFRYNIIQLRCENALGKKIKVHQLRHSRATYLHEVEKVPIEKIQVLLGHLSLNTTMIYTRVNPMNIFEEIKDAKEV